MTIHLPEGRARFIRALVEGGRFASENDAVDEALGLLEERERLRVGAREPAGIEVAVSEHDYPQDQQRAAMPTPTGGEVEPARKPIWEVIQEISATVPAEVWGDVPTDLAAQHDHYLYGTPKRTDL
jgi:Arc/MetJ-type ribon-helix-helix transcriptional regulator